MKRYISKKYIDVIHIFSELRMEAVYFLFLLLAVHAYVRNIKQIDEYTYLKDVQYGANTFALNLYKTTLKNETGNSIISPFSVYMVLVMALYGAKGVTKEELLDVLFLRKQGDNALLIGAKINLHGIIHRFNLRSSNVVCVAHRIFKRSSLSLNPRYHHILTDTFRSPLTNVDFTNSSQAAELMNQWIRSITSGKIDGIVAPVDLDTSMKLVLVNAIYFSGRWKVPFEPPNNWSESFYVNENLTKTVLFMHQTGDYRHGELTKMNAKFVVIPYEDNGNSMEATYMYIILPNELDGLATLAEMIDSLTLEDLENTMIETLELFVPKFNISSKFLLKDHLSQLGIKSAFSANANFDGMTEKHEEVAISQVALKTFITVDEMGTESAATSALPKMLRLRGLPFKINRPFLMVLATEDLILFMGKVMDPSA